MDLARGSAEQFQRGRPDDNATALCVVGECRRQAKNNLSGIVQTAAPLQGRSNRIVSNRPGKLQGERRVGDFAGFAIRPNKRVVCACDLEYLASVEEVYPILFDRYIVGQVNVKAGGKCDLA